MSNDWNSKEYKDVHAHASPSGRSACRSNKTNSYMQLTACPRSPLENPVGSSGFAPLAFAHSAQPDFGSPMLAKTSHTGDRYMQKAHKQMFKLGHPWPRIFSIGLIYAKIQINICYFKSFGINYFRSIIESNSLFHKIEQDNDLGIDAIIELIDKGQPTHHSIAVQIKSGDSYYDTQKMKCKIPVEDHYSYWLKYPLPSIRISIFTSAKIGYWVNLKNYLANNEDCSMVVFKIDDLCTFDKEHYDSIFFPLNNDRLPLFALDKAIEYFK